MLVVRLPISAPAPTRYKLIPRLAGFPSADLTALFRFTEAAFTTGFLDEVGGGRYGTGGAAIGGDHTEWVPTSQDNGGGPPGGLKLTGLRNFVGPAVVDVRGPFTVFTAATMASPAGAVSQGIVAVGAPPANGLMAWYQLLTGQVAGSDFAFYSMPTEDGLPASAKMKNTLPPAAATFDALSCFTIKHYGGGAMRFTESRAGRISTFTTTYDVTKMQGAPGSRTPVLPPVIGGLYPGIGNKFGGVYDALACYSRATSDAEDAAMIEAAAALAATRNRT